MDGILYDSTDGILYNGNISQLTVLGYPNFWDNIKKADMFFYMESPHRINQYGYPIELSDGLYDNIYQGGFDILSSFQTRGLAFYNKQIKSKDPVFLGQSLYNEKINQKLQNMIDIGFVMPFAYDIILGTDQFGKWIPKSIEMQTAIGYFFELMSLAQCGGYGGDSYIDAYTKQSIKDLKNIYKKKIMVLDIDPMTQRTSFDQIGMQQFINEDQSFPCSILDIFRDNDNRYVLQKDKQGNVIEKSNLKDYAIVCRSTIGNLKAVETHVGVGGMYGIAKTYDAEQVQTIQKFLHNDTLDRLWHPSWTCICDKADMKELEKFPNSQAHSLQLYRLNKNIPMGLYYVKPSDGNSGDGGGYFWWKGGMCTMDDICTQITDISCDSANVLIQEIIHPANIDTKIGSIKEESIFEIRQMFYPHLKTSGIHHGYQMARFGPSRDMHFGHHMQKHGLPTGSLHRNILYDLLQKQKNNNRYDTLDIGDLIKLQQTHNRTNFRAIMDQIYLRIEAGIYPNDHTLIPFGRSTVHKK